MQSLCGIHFQTLITLHNVHTPNNSICNSTLCPSKQDINWLLPLNFRCKLHVHINKQDLNCIPSQYSDRFGTGLQFNSLELNINFHTDSYLELVLQVRLLDEEQEMRAETEVTNDSPRPLYCFLLGIILFGRYRSCDVTSTSEWRSSEVPQQKQRL